MYRKLLLESALTHMIVSFLLFVKWQRDRVNGLVKRVICGAAISAGLKSDVYISKHITLSSVYLSINKTDPEDRSLNRDFL